MEKKSMIIAAMASLFFLATSVAVSKRLLAQSPAQESKVSVMATPAEPPPAMEGLATGAVKPFARKSNDVMKDILAHPTPVISLTFGLDEATQNKAPLSQLRVDLPLEATEPVERYWKAYLGFLYRTEFQHVSEPQKQVDEDRAISAVAFATHNKLRDLIIVAPDGPRKISFEEAGSIIKFIGLSAGDIIRQAKNRNESAAQR